MSWGAATSRPSRVPATALIDRTLAVGLREESYVIADDVEAATVYVAGRISAKPHHERRNFAG